MTRATLAMVPAAALFWPVPTGLCPLGPHREGRQRDGPASAGGKESMMVSMRHAIRSVIVNAVLVRERWQSGAAYNPLSARTVQDP